MTRRGVAGATAGTVYGLVDPRDKQIRYVGATMQTLPARLKGHLSHPATRVWEWLEGLREDGLIPEIIPLRESVPAAELLVDGDCRDRPDRQ